MVARGDLGVELSPQQVPTAQKRIIEAANRKQRFVITATQMLESMIANPRPTRAEASDVANAIFDGTDAVMLSGETAVGSYPVEAVTMMGAIAQEAEANLARWGNPVPEWGATQDDALAIVRAACEMVYDRDVSAICAFTRTGRTARLMSKARPPVPILAFTPFDDVRRYLALAWGVTPCLLPPCSTVEQMLEGVEATLKDRAIIQPGSQIVVIGGLPVDVQTHTNFIKLHTVGS
jgi:pyruvate kinase